MSILKAHDVIHETEKSMMEDIDSFVRGRGIVSIFTGKPIESYSEFLKEKEAMETEIKNQVKDGRITDTETKYFAIKKTISYEYDPQLLRTAIPEKAGDFIVQKESVEKSKLDKAIEKGVVSSTAKDALKQKSVSIAFISKEDIAKKEVQEFTI